MSRKTPGVSILGPERNASGCQASVDGMGTGSCFLGGNQPLGKDGPTKPQDEKELKCQEARLGSTLTHNRENGVKLWGPGEMGLYVSDLSSVSVLDLWVDVIVNALTPKPFL